MFKPSRFCLPLSIALGLCNPLCAQAILVDANNGPGTQFTSLAAATVAAPDGATLIVRPGAYVGDVTISGKGLTVLGDPGVRIVGSGSGFLGNLIVEQTSAAQAVVLRNLRVENYPIGLAVRIAHCRGPVVIENLTAQPTVLGTGRPSIAMSVVASRQVSVRASDLVGAAVSGSEIVFETCNVAGFDAVVSSRLRWAATPAIDSRGSTLQFAGGTILGGSGDGFSVFPDQPGIQINGDTISVRATTTVAGGSTSSTPAPAIRGSGGLRLDPAAILSQPPQVMPNPVVVALPSLRTMSAPLGGMMSAVIDGPVGDLAVLVVGLQGPTLQVAGIGDGFWLEPQSHLFAAVGTPQPSAPISSGIAVPNAPTFLGMRIGWQAVTQDGAGQLRASQPSIAVVF